MKKTRLKAIATVAILAAAILIPTLTAHPGGQVRSQPYSGGFTPVTYNLGNYSITVYSDHVEIGGTAYYFTIYTLKGKLVTEAQGSIKVNRIDDSVQNTVAVVTSGSGYQFTEIFDAGMNSFNPYIVLSGNNLVFSLSFHVNGLASVSASGFNPPYLAEGTPPGDNSYSEYFSGNGLAGVTGLQCNDININWMISSGYHAFLLGNITFSQINGAQGTQVTLFYGPFNTGEGSLQYIL